MPKAKWANSDLTVDDIEEVEPDQFKRYTGPALVGNGPAVYKVRVGRLKKAESKAGNDKIQFMAFVDGSWRREVKRYDGAPVFDDIPLTKGAVRRVRSFCDALGVSAKDLLERCVTNEDGVIIKIGNKVVGGDKAKPVYIIVDCEVDKSGDNPRVRPRFTGYLPLGEEDGAEEPDDSTDGDGADKDGEGDAPF